MNKFYLVIITTEETQEVPEIFAHETYEAALAQFHNTFVSKMAFETVKAIYCEIKNSAGTCVKKDRYEKEVVEG